MISSQKVTKNLTGRKSPDGNVDVGGSDADIEAMYGGNEGCG